MASRDAIFLRAEPQTDFSLPASDPDPLEWSTARLGSRRMWLLSVLVPLAKLYLCGVKVLLYQMFNRSFTLPGQVYFYFTHLYLYFLKFWFIGVIRWMQDSVRKMTISDNVALIYKKINKQMEFGLGRFNNGIFCWVRHTCYTHSTSS